MFIKRVLLFFSLCAVLAHSLAFTSETPLQQKPVTTQTKIIVGEFFKKILTSPLFLLTCAKRLLPHTHYDEIRLSEGVDRLEKIRRASTQYNQENSFSFNNSTDDFCTVVPKTYGFCGGMTEVLRSFSFLAFFDKENAHREVVPDREKEPDAWKEFYLSKVDSILKGKATVIPGFQNLHELSSDPVLERELKLVTAKEWAKEALRLSGFEMLLYARNEMKKPKIDALFDSLAKRVANGELPKVMFSAFAKRPIGGKRVHVVTLYKTEVHSDGTKRLYTWETNFHYNDIKENPPYIEIRPDGKMFYEPWYQDHVKSKQTPIDPKAGFVAFLLLPFSENSKMVSIWKELISFCSEKPELCSTAP